MATSLAAVSDISHDHIVLLLDTPDFENPPAWLSENFHIIEGGTHKGGSSRNKLIIFSDGTLIELLNWISTPTEFHDWAPKPTGLIDFALTSPQSAHDTYSAITQRLESGSGDGGLGVRFKQPSAGGRQRKDGQHCRWFVTKPSYSDGPNVPKPTDTFFPTTRLDTPFFCHDETPRELRVPSSDKTLTTHPCGAKGILSVEVVVPESHVEHYVKLYSAVTGAEPKTHGGFRYKPSTSVSFLLSAPNPEAMKGLEGRVGIEIHAPRDAEDEAWLKERGVGIREVRIFVPAKSEDEVDERPLDSEGIGASLVLVTEPVGR
ncbi:hypothetical protein PV11_07817 [Exophiala sideris]|uniref:Glyoxalase-like domain-containing protein n=1 Tax=Exophiala sideris TaxID=1016849 RepID=A0A0D1WYQ8_9EURO|nr:hypothetical protein PV11_07817 [Exophiala sideris]